MKIKKLMREYDLSMQGNYEKDTGLSRSTERKRPSYGARYAIVAAVSCALVLAVLLPVMLLLPKANSAATVEDAAEKEDKTYRGDYRVIAQATLEEVNAALRYARIIENEGYEYYIQKAFLDADQSEPSYYSLMITKSSDEECYDVSCDILFTEIEEYGSVVYDPIIATETATYGDLEVEINKERDADCDEAGIYSSTIKAAYTHNGESFRLEMEVFAIDDMSDIDISTFVEFIG